MTEKEINEFVEPFFIELENELNKNTIKVEKHPGNVYHVPVIWKLTPGQVVSGAESAFNLNPPVAGEIKDTVKRDEDKRIVIIRKILSYSAASRMFVNQDYTQLKLLTTQMVMSLENTLGFDHNTINAGQVFATFKRPGVQKIYLKESDNYAGFEIRLYSDTWSCVDIVDGQE